MSGLIKIRPLHKGVFVDIVDRDVTQKDLGNGKVLHLIPDDVFGAHDPTSGVTHPGIRPRWARVLEVGSEAADLVSVGDLVLCDYGKWSRKFSIGRVGDQIYYVWWISVDDISIIDRNGDPAAYIEGARELLSRLEYNIGNW